MSVTMCETHLTVQLCDLGMVDTRSLVAEACVGWYVERTGKRRYEVNH